MPNYCQTNHCSHLCLLVPGGHRCACPDGPGSTLPVHGMCNAAFEHPLAQPYKCECKNGGYCIQSSTNTNTIICKCQDNFGGTLCEELISKTKIKTKLVLRLVPSIFLFLIVLALACFVFFVFYVQKRNM